MTATHIYVGTSKKVWCDIKLPRDRHGGLRAETPPPLTEGEFIDGFGREADLCQECVKRCSAVRGEPNRVE